MLFQITAGFPQAMTSGALHKVISVNSVCRIIDETESQAAVLRSNLTLEKDRRESLEKQVGRQQLLMLF